MTDDIDIVFFSTVIFLAYFFVLELYKVIKNRDWILFGFILLIVALVLFAIYKVWPNEKENIEKSKTVDDQISEPLEIPEDIPEVFDVPDEFSDVRRDFEFSIPSETPNHSGLNEMDYSKFREIYQSPEFLKEFASSLRTSLLLKKKRYKELRIQFEKELSAFKDGRKETFADIFSGRKNEMKTSIEAAQKQIDEILPEIDRHLQSIQTEKIRASLSKALNDPREGLESLTGREEIKDFLAMRLYTFAKNPRIFFNKFQNIPLYAGSGYGKSKIAKVIGHVYSCSGILIRGHFIQTTKAGLVSPYVNETAHNTRTVLLSTLESVLFIDEAYDITPPKSLFGQSVDHGHEAITEIVNFIDKMIGLNIIVVAGYQDEMEERFMKANEGLERRFLPPIILKPYTSVQLTSILLRFLQEDNPEIKMKKSHFDYIYSLVKWVNEKDEKDIFKLQAGAMLILAGEIGYSIHGIPGAWPNQFETVIQAGFNRFLASKGLGIQERFPIGKDEKSSVSSV